jgi:hypothetical protein
LNGLDEAVEMLHYVQHDPFYKSGSRPRLPCGFFVKPPFAMATPKLVLLFAALGSAGPALAQRAAIAPLAPVTPAIVAPPPLGQPIDFGTSSQRFARPTTIVLDQPSRGTRPQPVFLLNSRIIVGGDLAKVNPQDIADIYVYRDANVPAKWRSLAANGILTITLKPHTKPELKTKSLAAIGRELRLRGVVTYQLEGSPIDDLSLRVATADIASLDTQPTDNGTVVNIHLVVPPPVVHPPGTILIRGTSGS